MDASGNTYGYVYIHWLLQIYIFPCCISWDGLETMTPQEQWAGLEPRSLFLASGLFAEITDFKPAARSVQDESRASYSSRKQGSDTKERAKVYHHW